MIRMHLDKVSQESLYEALHTFPGKVLNAEVKFVAAGIPRATLIKGSETESYLAQCSNIGVMPFTALDLHYVPRTGFFSPIHGFYNGSRNGVQPFFFSGEGSMEAQHQIPLSARQSGTIDQYLSGGKFHEIIVQIPHTLESNHIVAAYDLFRERVLGAFQRSGYHIFDGRVSTGDGNESCRLEVGKWYDHDVLVNIIEAAPDEVRKSAEDWFSGFAGKICAKIKSVIL